LARAWRRTVYAETAVAVHERCVLVLEAVLKYLASAAVAVWAARGARGEAVQKACEALVRPSLGHWTAISRACLPALPADDPVRKWIERVHASVVSSEVAGLEGRTVGKVLDSLPAYRNALAHGTGLKDATAFDRAPRILALARNVLTALMDERAPTMFGRAGQRAVRLMGPAALPSNEEADSLPADLVLRLHGRAIVLTPLWIFDPDEDDVLVLNKGAGLTKVEYLSYGVSHGGTGLVVRKGPAAELATRFLESATGRRSLGTSEVAAMIEESEVRELLGRATEQWIGPYRVVRQFAKGGQGVLYEAIQEHPPRRVALKVLPLHAAVDDVARRRFKEEGEALGRVEHPGVVPVYSTGEQDGVPWIAMRYVEGRSLAEVFAALRGHAGEVTLLDWNEAASTGSTGSSTAAKEPYADRAAEIIRDAALALQACHENGVVHRDVKPGNVMIDSDGRVLITDFGLARTMSARSRTLTNRFVGTLQYAAPESLLPVGKQGPDARVDVYGLGATLYEALSLRRPFVDYERDEGALLCAVQAKEPPALRKIAPWVPRDLTTIATVAMEKDRDARYANAAAMARDLEHYLKGEPIEARPAGLIVRGRKWARRHPGKTVAMAAVLVTLLFGIGYAVGRRIARDCSVKERLAGAESFLASGEFDRARVALGQALELDPGSLEALDLRNRITTAATDAQRESARNQARAARAIARQKESEYQQLRGRMAELRTQINRDHYAYFSGYASEADRAALARLQRRHERMKARAEHLLQTARDALEQAARHEEAWGGNSAATDAAFADHFIARWREAVSAMDAVREAAARASVEKYDRDKRYAVELACRGTLHVSVDPADAELFLFRYRSYDEVRPEPPVVPRLVPVPTRGVHVARDGPWVDDFYPGDLCLVVTGVTPQSPAANSGLGPGDLVIRLNGLPCGDGLLVQRVGARGPADEAGVNALDRLEFFDRERVEGWYEWKNPRCEDGEHTHRLVVAGRVVEARCRKHETKTAEMTFRMCVASPADLIRGGAPADMRLRCLHDGVLLTLDVPAGEQAGIQCETSAYPLVRSPENRVPAGKNLDVDAGSYLILARSVGHEDQRFPACVRRRTETKVEIRLNRDDTTPDGFVYVPAGSFKYGGYQPGVFARPRCDLVLPAFFMARKEVTFGEYLEFLNAPETLEAIERKDIRPTQHLPRIITGALVKREVPEFGGLCVRQVGTNDTPLMGVSYDDVVKFLAWKNGKAAAAGDAWEYVLPTEEQWEKAARGVDARRFPWGNRFDFSLTVSKYSEFPKDNLMGEEPGGIEPRDESPYGILDMAGSRLEWTRTADERAPDFFILRGGAWSARRDLSYHLANRITSLRNRQSGKFGFRLVLRRRR